MRQRFIEAPVILLWNGKITNLKTRKICMHFQYVSTILWKHSNVYFQLNDLNQYKLFSNLIVQVTQSLAWHWQVVGSLYREYEANQFCLLGFNSCLPRCTKP